MIQYFQRHHGSSNRTDKTKETEPTSGEEYVEKMFHVIQGVSPLPTVNHCYVATDDVAAVKEIKSALKRANIFCTVHALQMSKQGGGICTKQRQKTLQ